MQILASSFQDFSQDSRMYGCSALDSQRELVTEFLSLVTSVCVWFTSGFRFLSFGKKCLVHLRLEAIQEKRIVDPGELWIQPIQEKRIMQPKLNCRFLELGAELLWCNCSPAGSSAETFVFRNCGMSSAWTEIILTSVENLWLCGSPPCQVWCMREDNCSCLGRGWLALMVDCSSWRKNGNVQIWLKSARQVSQNYLNPPDSDFERSAGPASALLYRESQFETMQ